MKNNVDQLWSEITDQLEAFIFSKVKDKSISEDLLQDIFIKIHTKIDMLRDETKIQSWIYQITRNTINDYFRKSTHKFGIENIAENSIAESDHFFDEAINDMIKFMKHLPEQYCEALCETEFNGLSQKEFAEKLGISYSGAKSRVQRARKILKDLLLNCCHYQFDKHGSIINIQPNCYCCNPPENN